MKFEHHLKLAQISGSKFLVPFNSDLPAILKNASSPYGLSEVLSHKMIDFSDQLIAFASRSLTYSKGNHNQLHK